MIFKYLCKSKPQSLIHKVLLTSTTIFPVQTTPHPNHLAFHFSTDKPIQPSPPLSQTTNKPVQQSPSLSQSTNKQPIEQLLLKYKKQSNNESPKVKALFLKNLLKTANNRGVSAENNEKICKCMEQVISFFVGRIQKQGSGWSRDKDFVSGMINLVHVLSLDNIRKIVNMRLVQKNGAYDQISNKNLAKAFLKIYNSQQLRAKTQILKFITKYHRNDKQLSQQLYNSIKQNINSLSIPIKDKINIQNTIFYLKQIFDYLQKSASTAATTTTTTTTTQIKTDVNWLNVNQVIDVVEAYILLLEPKLLFIFSQVLVQIGSYGQSMCWTGLGVLLNAVQVHVKGMKLIESLNPYDAIYLIQTLENMLKIQQLRVVNSTSSQDSKQTQKEMMTQIRKITNEIYQIIKNINKHEISAQLQQQQQKQQIKQQEVQKQCEEQANMKQQQEQKQNEDEKTTQQKQKQLKITNYEELRLIDINIIMESMLKLSVIDATLFRIFQIKFFRLVPTSDVNNIQSYIISRVKIVKAVLTSLKQEQRNSTRQKMRLVKQQHKRFIQNLLDKLNENPSLSIRQKLKLLQLCQQVSIKSKLVKRKLSEMATKQKLLPQQIAFLQVVQAIF